MQRSIHSLRSGSTFRFAGDRIRSAARTTIELLEQRQLLSASVNFGPDQLVQVPVGSVNAVGKAAATGNANGHLTIVPTFDSTITSDPNAATIEGTINAAIAVYESHFSDPITVTITFQEMTSGLGQSLKYFGSVPYSTYRTQLAADATTADDATALSHIPTGTTNPVNGSTSMDGTLPQLRVLGFSANAPAGQTDGTIGLNTSICNLNRTNINPSKYDLMAVASHEIDEVLAFGSALNNLNNGDPTPTGAVWGDDLYRYDQNGARSFNTTEANQAYFSFDGGATDLARFNQTAGGDFSDWYSAFGGNTPQVQDAFSTPGATPNLNVELRRLDVLGFTPITATQPPVANNDTATTNENTAVLINELSNDTASGGATIDPTTVHIVTAPGHGTTSIDAATGKITYTPAGNYFGADSLTYTVKDSNGAVSNAATISITVNQVFSPPVAVNDSYSTPENNPLTVNAPGVQSNDTDPAGLTFTSSVVSLPAHGALTLNSNGSFTYTPVANYHGSDSFTYHDADSHNTSNTATVSLTVVATPPVANNDSYVTLLNTALTINAPGVLSNDTDVNGLTLTPTVVTNPTHGTLTLNSNGSFTYTPTTGYTGPDSYTYHDSDGVAASSNVATVSISVSASHQPPVANNDIATTNENTAVLINELSNDTASGGATIDPTTVHIVSATSHGGLSVDAATGKITYTPASNYIGSDSLTYTVKDSTGAVSNTATVSITVNPVITHQPPVANNDSATTNENTAVLINELSNDTASGGATIDSTTVLIGTAAGHGSTSVDPVTGRITYTPAANYVGPDSFTYTVKDSTGATSNAATVAVNVTPANAGELVAHGVEFHGVEGTPIASTIVATFSDTDHAPRTSYQALINFGDGSSAPGVVQLSGDRYVVLASHTYSEEGKYHVTVQITDSDGSTATANSTAVIADARLTSWGNRFSARHEHSATVLLGTFTDANPSAALSDFTGVAYWGDGGVSTVSISQDPISKVFSVYGTHNYAHAGTRHLMVIIKDVGGNSTEFLSEGIVS